ncbi:unnamed protein product [Ostreobium quekettii]|uniref:DUF1254 domain-containing protein n=1 Tax=Ostreobium quekettii TaxID=121088 RepID=A0A8S1IXI7_9CHLO|nr:unnamed protein product [Ostreobium quekettii]|eukprot:evm.model.scf_834.1 EVM.evm.TU.scf_834.1   scf_834:32140-33681(+)
MVSKWMCVTAIVLATLGISACVPAEEAPDVASDRAPLCGGTKNCEDSEIGHTAQQAYVYGYPLMLMEYTKRALLQQPGGQVNRFLHQHRRPDPSDTAVVRPNQDTLYSVAFLDLSDGPQILDVPEVRDRYFLLQLLDGWSTSIAGSPGTANTGTEAQSFAIVGPGYEGSVDGVSGTYHLDTNLVWILGRTRIKQGERDRVEVIRTQRGYCLRSLADFQNGDRSNCERSVSLSDVGEGLLGMLLPETPPPPEIVGNMAMGRFLMELATLMADNPGYPADDALLSRFENVLGFVVGKPYTPSLSVLAAIQPAREAALRSMRAHAVGGLGQQSAGWSLALRDIGEYGDDYLRRAAVALVGFGANLPKDAIYPTSMADDRDQPLRGDQRYRLRFADNKSPPVVARFDGFWSVSLYDDIGFFIENPEQRYVVHSWELEPATDRDVDIYIGCDDRAAFDGDGLSGDDFWLPAATTDPIVLTLRMYAPGDAALPPEGGADDDLPAWTPPAIEWLGACSAL